MMIMSSFGRGDGQHCHLGLIDFGCAIDVELFPSGTRFSVDKNTESFECIEMKTQRPWTTQVCLCRNGHIIINVTSIFNGVVV